MIYLASPYSHYDARVREQRFREACSATARLISAGLNVFSPIVHSHSIAHYGLPANWEYWSRFDREFLSCCDVLAVLTLHGWQQSVGVAAEIRMAGEFGLPVVHVTPTDLDGFSTEPLHRFSTEAQQA